jgi:hypothetical protein
MPFRTSRTHRQKYDVLRDLHFSQLSSRFFDSSYVAADTYQNKYIYPGLVVALDSATSKYVPYNASASYGTGSDTAVGVLIHFHDLTYGDKMVAPIWHGVVKDDLCFLYGSALGSVTTAVKTALDDIEWV